MTKWEISAREAGWLLAGIVSLTGHALTVTQFMRAGGRDTWLTGISSLPLAALALWSWYKLGRIFPGKTLVQYLPKVLGYLGYPLAFLYPLYYFVVVIFTLRITTDWLVDSILPETPSWILGALYIATVLYAALGGLDVLARVNQFILPLLTGLGMLVSAGTSGSKDYRLLLPLLEFGLGPLMAATWLTLGYFGEMSVISMFGAYIRPMDRSKALPAYLLAMLYEVVTLSGPLAGSIATLGYQVAVDMPYPTFKHWLMVSFARFFERTDLLAIHQWLAGAYTRCGVYLLMSATGFLQLFGQKLKRIKWVLVAMGLVVVVASELLWRTKVGFDQFVTYIYLPAGAILGIALPPFYVLIALVRGLQRQSKGWSHGA